MIDPTVDDFEFKLDKDALRKLDIREQLHEIGEDAKANAKRMAPVDTGALRNSIDYEVTEDSRLYLYSQVDYGAYVELGTRRSPAQPHLRPGLEQAVKKKR